jgi:hypothetical protein
VIQKPQECGGLDPHWAVAPEKKKNIPVRSFSQKSFLHQLDLNILTYRHAL